MEKLGSSKEMYAYLSSILSGDELLHATAVHESIVDAQNGKFAFKVPDTAINNAWNEVQWLKAKGVDLARIGIDERKIAARRVKIRL